MESAVEFDAEFFLGAVEVENEWGNAVYSPSLKAEASQA